MNSTLYSPGGGLMINYEDRWYEIDYFLCQGSMLYNMILKDVWYDFM